MVKKMQEQVRELLKNKDIDLVIGWGRGTQPLTATPVFIHNPEEADSLIFDETCRNNLAVYLTKDKRHLVKQGKKIGILVKGCDARSLVLYGVENQINKDNITVIGMPCNGVLDTKKVSQKTGGREVLEYRISKDQIEFTGKGFTETCPLQDVMSLSCRSCAYPDAPVHDIFIGEPRSGAEDTDVFSVVDEFEKLSLDERWDAMVEEYSNCIRCYACRNVCPSCYCSECFVDQNDPQWIGKTPEVTDTIIFHLIRNLHIAGRCVECGACERACPMDLDLLKINKKISKEIRERFNYTAGLDIDEKPVMASYCENEKQDFIMG